MPELLVLEEGQVLGRYRIERFLAEGGMGRVYCAFDRVLRRRVALKLLAIPEAPGSPAIARLLRGARAAAAFSHPHVCSVFDAGEIDGRPFIAMELIEGAQLRGLVGDPGVDLARRLRWVLELASALAATHRARVVHRDIKPDNVMIDADDRARLLDFGVAIRDGGSPLDSGAPEVPAAGAFDTQAGRVIGTRGYMAPEQLAGEPVDARSDQFAWGVLAYETIGGRHPFPTPGELRTGALLSAVAPALPFGVAAIVAKAMAFDPAQRFADMNELIGQLSPLVTAAAAPALPPAQVGPGRRRTALAVATAAAALAGAGAIVRPRHTDTAAAAEVLAIAEPRRVTFGDGCEEFPSFTRDGRAVIYSGGDADGNYHLYRVDLAPGSAPRIVVPEARPGWDLAPAVSPRGDRVAFLHMDSDRAAAMIAPIDGSAPPRALGDASVYPRWSADGRGVWAGRRGGPALLDAATGEVLRTLALPGDLRATWVAERADGAVVAHLHHGDPSAPIGLALLGADGALRWQLSAQLEPALALSPDGSHALASRQTFGGGAELVAIPLDGSPIVSLSATGVIARDGLEVSADGRRLAWSNCRAVAHVSAIDAAGRIVPALTGEETDAIAFAAIPASADLAVVSERSGPLRLWVIDPAGARAPRLIATGDRPVRAVAIAPDGVRFVVALEGAGLATGSLRRDAEFRMLTDHAGDSAPGFRRGGDDVVFSRRLADGTVRVMQVPVRGGSPAPLLEPGSHDAAASPADDRIVYLAGTPTATPMVTDPDGAARPLSPALDRGRYRDPRISPDGRRIALVRGDRELLEIDAASGDLLRTVTPGPGDALHNPVYAAAGLIVLRARWQGNIWIADARFAAAAREPAPGRR